jgi:hypothetical protein
VWRGRRLVDDDSAQEKCLGEKGYLAGLHQKTKARRPLIVRAYCKERCSADTREQLSAVAPSRQPKRVVFHNVKHK